MLQITDEDLYREACKILRFLLLGIDPQTNQKLSVECIIMDPDVQRSLSLGLDALQDSRRAIGWLRAQKSKRACQSGSSTSKRLKLDNVPSKVIMRPGRAGQPWSSQEDKQIEREFRSGKVLRKLAAVHQRTRGGIVSRLAHLGLCNSREEARASFTGAGPS